MRSDLALPPQSAGLADRGFKFVGIEASERAREVCEIAWASRSPEERHAHPRRTSMQTCQGLSPESLGGQPSGP